MVFTLALIALIASSAMFGVSAAHGNDIQALVWLMMLLVNGTTVAIQKDNP